MRTYPAATKNWERVNEVYLACIRYTAKNQNFPTYRWIMANTDLTSTSMVKYYLDKLIYMKLISRIPNQQNAWKITGAIWMPPINAELPPEPYDELLHKFVEYSTKIPMSKYIPHPKE